MGKDLLEQAKLSIRNESLNQKHSPNLILHGSFLEISLYKVSLPEYVAMGTSYEELLKLAFIKGPCLVTVFLHVLFLG